MAVSAHLFFMLTGNLGAALWKDQRQRVVSSVGCYPSGMLLPEIKNVFLELCCSNRETVYKQWLQRGSLFILAACTRNALCNSEAAQEGF